MNFECKYFESVMARHIDSASYAVHALALDPLFLSSSRPSFALPCLDSVGVFTFIPVVIVRVHSSQPHLLMIMKQHPSLW